MKDEEGAEDKREEEVAGEDDGSDGPGVDGCCLKLVTICVFSPEISESISILVSVTWLVSLGRSLFCTLIRRRSVNFPAS